MFTRRGLSRCARWLPGSRPSTIRRAHGPRSLHRLAWRVATSPRRARASGRSATASARCVDAAHRRASRRDDRAAVSLRRRAAHLRDALRADDRRDRQPGDRAAVQEVPPAGGLPRRSARGARGATSARPAHSARRRATSRERCGCSSSSTTARCRCRLDELVRLPGVGRKTANVVVVRARRAGGDRRGHARPPAVAAARPHPPRGSGEASSATSFGSCRAPTGALPAPAHLARTAGLQRAVRRGATTACSRISARLAECDEGDADDDDGRAGEPQTGHALVQDESRPCRSRSPLRSRARRRRVGGGALQGGEDQRERAEHRDTGGRTACQPSSSRSAPGPRTAPTPTA